MTKKPKNPRFKRKSVEPPQPKASRRLFLSYDRRPSDRPITLPAIPGSKFKFNSRGV